MPKNRTFIHIGCHKAGSTFVQEELLQKLKNIKPITFFNKKEYLEKEFLYISQCADIYYENNIEKIVSEYYQQFENIFISAEGLSGHGYNVFTGGFLIESIAKRLHNTFPEGKILIIIRNQKDSIESIFKDDVKYGYLSDFESWFNWRLNAYQLNYFKYYNLIKVYQNIFGKDKVKVILFEKLFDLDYLKNMLNDFGVNTLGIENVDLNRSYNKAYSPLSLKITPIVNRIFGSKLSHGVTFGNDPRLKVYNFWRHNVSKYLDKISLKAGFKKSKFNFPGYENLLYEQFHNDNLRLSEIIDTDLLKYNYL